MHSIASGGLLECFDGMWSEPHRSYLDGTTLSNDAQTHPFDFKLGMLEFVACIVKDDRVTGWLMRCRCGRYMRLSFNFMKGFLKGRMKDMPWCCGKCGRSPDHKAEYYPWPQHYAEPLHLTHVHSNHDYRVVEDDFRLFAAVANRTTHPREYRVWEGIIEFVDTHPPWRKSFGKFLEDVGERPSSAHVLRIRNTRKGYIPSNTYWHKHNYVVVKGKERQDHFAAKELDVPKEYVTACRRGGLLDGEEIQKQYKAGNKPPTRYYELDHNRPQQFLLD